MTDHKATTEQWALLQRQSQTLGSAESMALLELRARVEALEAAQQPTIKESLTVVPAGSLVERVSCAIDGRINPDQWLHQDAARAAIREVAVWFSDRATPGTPQWIAAAELTDEVER